MGVTVSVSELYQLAKDMLNDGMDYVEVTFIEHDEDEEIPSSLNFEASKRTQSYMGIDYGFLEDISSTL